jgi:NADH dehydrogenase FAD-containing subunit
MIDADALGKPRTAFRYFDKGDMATIGRHMAVADVRWPFYARLSGYPAWLAWLSIHFSSWPALETELQCFCPGTHIPVAVASCWSHHGGANRLER